MSHYDDDIAGLRDSGQLGASAQGLAFSAQPVRVFAGSPETPLTIKFQNPPGPNASIPFDYTTNGDQITIQIPDALVANFSFAVKVVKAPNGNNAQWTAAPPSAGKVKVFAANKTQLDAGDVVEVQLSSLTIADTPAADIAIPIETRIYICDDNKQGSTSITGLSIVAKQPGVIAWADPPVIGLHPSPLPVLHWSTSGGTTLEVWPFTVDRQNPDYYKKFDPHVVHDTTVNPSVQQKSFDLQLYAGSKRIDGAKDSVNWYFNPPVISDFGFVRKGSIVRDIELTLGERVTLKWLVSFVDGRAGVTLHAGSGSTIYPPSSFSIPDYDPAANDQLAPNGSTVKLTLLAPGYDKVATQDATVTYKAVKFLYFKYEDPGLTTQEFATDPTGLPVSLMDTPGEPGVTMATLNGPGGPYVLYLGTGDEKHLEIRYFSASKAKVKSGEKFTLDWITHEAEKLELAFPTSGTGHFSIEPANFGKGTSPEISLTETTTFILRATGLASTVDSYLDVTVEKS